MRADKHAIPGVGSYPPDAGRDTTTRFLKVTGKPGPASSVTDGISILFPLRRAGDTERTYIAAMRHKVLINPRAAGGRPLELLPKMREWTADHPHTYDYVITESRNHLIEEASAARNEAYDSVLAMGGDGTMHDVVSTARLDGPLYGMLPCGRGNDFPRNLGFPGSLRRAVQGMRNPGIETIDLPTINGKPFLSIAGVGFDSLIARKVRDSKCRFGGTLCYVIALFQVLTTFKPVELTFFIDGDTMLNGRYMLVVAANGKAYGGGMTIAPHADIGDGYL
ncbi:hypothetical protein GF324_03345, partial [bacterium]|nr:hypothetical protein [bacterium]